jgi:SAM-dependent methyltransferase
MISNAMRIMLRLGGAHYGEHGIAAAPGTHEAVLASVLRHCSKGARILDLASYTGAMLARLRDQGFSNLAAADLTNHLSASAEFSFTQCDFNNDFAAHFAEAQFDCIIASEIIEHLDDPRHFLTECRKLLATDGTIIVSTPNIAFFEGRIKFALTGELWGFGHKNYVGQRHISAISREQFPLMFDECGFRQLESITAGSFATGLRKTLTAPIWVPMRFVLGSSVLGETLICVAMKADFASDAHSSAALWGGPSP